MVRDKEAANGRGGKREVYTDLKTRTPHKKAMITSKVKKPHEENAVEPPAEFPVSETQTCFGVAESPDCSRALVASWPPGTRFPAAKPHLPKKERAWSKGKCLYEMNR